MKLFGILKGCAALLEPLRHSEDVDSVRLCGAEFTRGICAAVPDCRVLRNLRLNLA